MSTFVLDARRLLCPMPVIRVQEKVSDLTGGDILNVICSDPGAIHDIPSWCRISGHKVVETVTSDDDEITITIEVGST